jgi:hypothetical protein
MKGGMTMLVAELAVETGIAPNDLLDAPPDVFRAILQVVNDKRKAHNREAKRRA